MLSLLKYLGVLIFCTSFEAQAQVPSTFVYQGQITRSSGQPLEANPVIFTVQIYSPSNDCLMYEEQHSINMLGTDGVFSLNVGAGIRSGSNFEDTSSIASVFQNGFNFTGITTCLSGSSYNALSGHTRKVRISYNDGGGAVTLAQDFHLQAAPYAWYANSLQGLTPNNFVQINSGQNVTQSNLENLLGGTNYTTLLNLASGNPTTPLNLNNQQIKNLAEPTLAQDAATKNYSDTKIAGRNLDITGVGAGIGSGRVLSWNGTLNRWEAVVPSSTDATKLPLSGGTMSGNINMSGNQVLNLGHITLQNLATITLGKFDNAQEATLVGSLNASNEGAVWFNSQTNALMYWDGALAQAVGSGGGGSGDITAVTAGTGLSGGGVNGSVTLNIATGGVTTAEIFDGTIATVDIADSAVTDGKINSLNITKITSGPAEYFGYRPAGTECLSGEVLKWDATNDRWLCGSDNNSSGVTSVFTRSGAVTAQAGDYSATQIVNSPTGTISATTLQAAINELDTEKLAKTGDAMTGALTLNAQNEIRFADGDSSNYVAFRSPTTVTANVVWTLPGTDGLSGQILSTNGSGVLSWSNASAGDITSVMAGSGLANGGTAGAVTLDVATGGITSTHIFDGTIATGDIANLAVTDAKIDTVSVDKIANGATRFFKYKPNNTNCANLETLKWNNTLEQWECGADNNSNTITSVFSRTGAVIAQSGDYTASQITNTAAGNLSATTTQAAVNELDAEKLAKAGDSMSGALTLNSTLEANSQINLNAQNELRFRDSDSSNYLAFRSPATVGANVVWTLPIADGTNGQILSTNGSGVLSWSSASVGDITSVIAGSGLAGGGTSGAVTLDVATGGITSTHINDGTIATGDIADNAVTNQKINSLSITKITSAPTEYFSYMPAGMECLTNEVLKWDATNDRWICATDNNSGGVTTVFTRSGAVTAQAGDYTATQITNTAAGNIAATNAQTAINELDTEKLAKSGDNMAGALTLNAQSEVRFADSDSSNYVSFRSPATVGTNVVWTLPNTDGTNGQILSTNGAGVLSWANASSGSVTSLTGDVTSTGSGAVATTVVKLQGYDVAATAPVDGKFLKYVGGGSTEWTPSDIRFFDIKDNLGNSAFVGMGSCTNGQTVLWSSLTDTFQCQAIGNLSAGAIATGVVDAARLPAASGTADGIVNQIAQSFAGLKTFLGGISTTTLATSGAINSSGGVTTTTLSASSDIVTLGGVKIGTVATACNATTEGTIRYNSTLKKMEFCNATAWSNISSGTQANLSIGAPSSSLVRSGPVTFTVTYGSGADTATITLATGNITLGGTATTGCSVTSVTGAGSTRTVTVNGCSGTGTVNISIAANTAQSTTGDPAPAAGPSSTYQVDNTGPSAPTSVMLGSVPSNLSTSPTITYTAGVDSGGSTVANHQVRIIRTSNSALIYDWTNHTSGAAVTGITLDTSTQYTVFVRAVDALGNIGTATAGDNWTSINDPCLGSPSPGAVCAGGSIFLGSLSPGATSGSGTDKYMTTPGGCGEIPAGQQGGGSGASAWPNADFTPTCSGTDSLTKYWNDGTSNWYDIPGLTNYTSTEGTGFGASNTDQYYGSQNTTNIVAITSAGQGGYHAAARYCDRLSYGGYTDWHLPNRYELNLFWTNRASIPGLVQDGNWYWSSTEYVNANSWVSEV
ncbi:MAG: DUF1566 domain-containing protein [Bdellovibrionales bacterium]|nr:DUF1566 domain-containing protein [Bdellovibrionales bacterium]